MANPHADLQALTVRRDASNGPILRPPTRWLSRIALPGLLLVGFTTLLVWASWDYLIPSTPITVSPVVARSGIVQASGVSLFTTSGFIEPRPNPIEVTALAEGVVDKLLVHPGQRVQAGDVVAQLIETDADLALQAAQEDLAERKTKVRLAEADTREAEAQLRGSEANLKAQANLKDKLYGELAEIQAVSARDMAKAKIEQNKARMEEAVSRVRQGEIAVRTAELRLRRMTVRTPVSGVVMNLNVRPGRMVGGRSPAGGQHDTLITLYDPERLQIRALVRVDLFQHVLAGQEVEIESDALPGQKLFGVVLYDVPETEINQNSVFVKVGLQQWSLRAAAPVLSLPSLSSPQSAVLGACLEAARSIGVHERIRPEMRVLLRFLSPPSQNTEAGGEVLRIFVPHNLLVGGQGESQLWIVDQSAGRAILRTVVPGKSKQGDLIEITQGLQPSDKLITSGRELLHPGTRIRIVGEN